jgi:hypothetical protein
MPSPFVETATSPPSLLCIGRQGWGPLHKRSRVEPMNLDVVYSKGSSSSVTSSSTTSSSGRSSRTSQDSTLTSTSQDEIIANSPSDSTMHLRITPFGFPMIVDPARSMEVKNQRYMGPRPIVVPIVPTPTLTIEALKDLSKRRAAKSQAIAARILAETGGPSPPNKARERPKTEPVVLACSPPMPVLTMETLKDMSTRRARESKDIAARILAEDKARQKSKISPENNMFPCPAKKMGPAHNRNTALFAIPVGSPHGMPLLCSHAMCRKGRLKFVYCRYCHQPVSRMKFDERHAHPEQLLMAFADTTTTAATTTTALSSTTLWSSTNSCGNPSAGDDGEETNKSCNDEDGGACR